MKQKLLITIASLILCCGLTTYGDSAAAISTTQKILANGDKVVIQGNVVTAYDTKGQMIQQSTFTTPTFLEARSFLVEMQQDLASKHYTDFLQGDISYPISVNSNGKTVKYQNTEQLQAAFDKVFTPAILQIILAQDPDLLFANEQGVMIGDGTAWFNGKGIFVINLSY